MNPIYYGSTPFFTASKGKKGAILEYTELVRKFKQASSTITQSIANLSIQIN